MTDKTLSERIDALVKQTFPERVWFPTSKGWASRKATESDTKARKRWIKDFLLRRASKEN